MTLANDTTTVPSIDQQQENIRRVRGWVLGHGFAVEDALVTAALAHEFGTLDSDASGEPFTNRSEALRFGTELARKIDIARDVIRKTLPQAEADRLIQDLAEYRRLRHLLAHRPCWLEGIFDPEAGTYADMPKGRTVGFRLHIADSDFVWEIDEAQCKEWGELLDRCRMGVEAVRAKHLPAPDGAPEQLATQSEKQSPTG
jgi:hypothetical protein